jgi:hypothetical protein
MFRKGHGFDPEFRTPLDMLHGQTKSIERRESAVVMQTSPAHDASQRFAFQLGF